jgi:hydroxymethylpyrimidine/phosphomethylpyrimidine kinase
MEAVLEHEFFFSPFGGEPKWRTFESKLSIEKMKYNRPIALSIAGFDPTGGAGVLADIKTFEQFQVLGFGVLSATTIQTETTFHAVNWLSTGQILDQLKPLATNYELIFIKIGIVASLESFNEILTWIHQEIPSCQIVWDPVMAASSGFQIHNDLDINLLIDVLKKVTLITPNVPEAKKLSGKQDENEAGEWLSRWTNVLLKGGHSEERFGADLLYVNGENQLISAQTAGEKYSKHGSGCILSASITAGMAIGKSLEEACKLGKEYTEKRLSSNKQLLAYHVE